MAVKTVRELIENLTHNYGLDEPIAYTIYSESDIMDAVPFNSEDIWAEIVHKVGGAIEYYQGEINQLITDEYLEEAN